MTNPNPRWEGEAGGLPGVGSVDKSMAFPRQKRGIMKERSTDLRRDERSKRILYYHHMRINIADSKQGGLRS